ncbi:MAG: recombinase family protein, partial [Alphaproteobacteria bacterium]|nr:recombinase family protein [Alphaproteobacteria bacterium]
YHLLSNPLYIGKIKHHEQVFDGLHDALIREDLWDEVQATLSNNRIKRKRRTNAASRSLLAGKLFDTNGGKLTASHACKGATRYRYYVSADPKSGYRLPAKEIERVVERAVSSDPDVRTALTQCALNEDGVFNLVKCASIHEDQIDIQLKVPGRQVRVIRVPFSTRRRGVETKLVIPNEHARIPDRVMIRRVWRALNWTDRIKAGESVKAIAESENVSSDFITHNIDLAFLSPDILRAILDGKQRPDLSTAQLSRRRWPINWSEQSQDFIA